MDAPTQFSPIRGPCMSEQILNVTDDSFDNDVLKADLPVLVDFWAQWCGPCKMIAPILEDIAKTYAGKVIIAKMDIDSNNGVPAKYGIRGIPTLMVFIKGALEATKVGALTRAQLVEFLDNHI